MSHLLAISIGPVQEFIAAARRTRDLWFGSYLLSEVSRAVAKSIESTAGRLIFPASSDAENVANIILAELPCEDPKEIAAKAKLTAQQRWSEFAHEARRQAHGVIRADIWEEQVHDVIEFYAAWVTRSADYRADRSAVMRLLSGRKQCREFLPARGRAGVPKSSLDGQRESVLKDPARERWPERFRAQLRLREGEQLDVVGIVKRLAGGNRSYPSVARIAADPWLRGNQDRLTKVHAACREIGEQVIRRLDTTAFPQFAAFPYEGTSVYVSRHHELAEETEATTDGLQALQKSLDCLPQPEPYFAVLVADGDRMGAAISSLDSPDAHRRFSDTLSGFAQSARAIVNEHSGVLVYAGGDDVLAFLPVDLCLKCARKLHDEFGKRLAAYGNLTLSVGIAVGHFMENLEDLLEYGRSAEKAAKRPDRNGLAVHLHKRGGAPIRIRSSWNADPDHRLERFALLISDGVISRKLPYELLNFARLYESWTGSADAAIQQDLFRLIAKKSSRGTETVRQALSKDLESLNSAGLLALAQQLLVARQLARTQKQAGTPLTRTQEVTS
jgi:CRISPR-associated protein Cmr2